MSWYEESLVYQIYPLGLLGAPYENDGTGPVEHRLPRLSGWVGHLQRLGVGCVLLNPVFATCSSSTAVWVTWMTCVTLCAPSTRQASA